MFTILMSFNLPALSFSSCNVNKHLVTSKPSAWMSRDLFGVPISLYQGQGHLAVLHDLYLFKRQDHPAGHFYNTGDTNHLTE